MPAMTPSTWPDPLAAPDPRRVDALLSEFWRQLAALPDLIRRDEQILAERCTAELRTLVIEMMLALNGIGWPAGTRHLNSYLGDSQRAVLERTLAAPQSDGRAWTARAVALVVIYRWYAPQLTARFGLAYPDPLEQDVWRRLVQELPGWPQTVTTEDG
jgi:hypothetical protein